VNDKEIKNVDELGKSIGSSKALTVTGFYPGYDGLYDYPINIEE